MCNSWMGRRRGRCARWLVSGFVLAGVLWMVRPAFAGFSIQRETVWADRTHRQAHFELQFSRAPDFEAIDSTGRPRDSFQLFINPDWHRGDRDLKLDIGQFRDVVRGEEIHLNGHLPVRDGTPTDAFGPTAGGWGKSLGAVPIAQNGATVDFQIPFHMLRETDGDFSYALISTENGIETSSFTGTTVPLPPGAWTGLATLGLGVVWLGGRRLLARRVTALHS
jgi:hypothetical protein